MLKIEVIQKREQLDDIIRLYDEKVSIPGWKDKDRIILEDISAQDVEYCMRNLPDENFHAFPNKIEETILDNRFIGYSTFDIVQEEVSANVPFQLHEYKSKWSREILIQEMEKQILAFDNLQMSDIFIDGEYCEINFKKYWKRSEMPSLKEMTFQIQEQIKTLLEMVENNLEGIVWKEEYEKEEALFCREIVTPLLLKMPFLSVRYTHGVQEYGKDYIVSSVDVFDFKNYYGIQVKAGDIDGKVNSKIDEIIGQIEDAFSMPMKDINAEGVQYISHFILLISGHYSNNAKEKIREKIPRNRLGAVYFLEKEDIQRLMEKYWKK